MNLIINEDNLNIFEVQEFQSKVRAIILDENNNLVINNYNGIYSLPGGSTCSDETIIESIIQKLKTKNNQYYDKDELKYLNCIDYYQKDFPNNDGTVSNRLIRTYFFVGAYKEPIYPQIKDSVQIELVSLDDINVFLNDCLDNPKNLFFQNELLEIIKYYNRQILKLKKEL